MSQNRLLAFGWFGLLWLAALPTTGACRVMAVGPGGEFPTPSAAALVAQDGDRVVIAPGRYQDCAVWHANGLVVEGPRTGEPAVIGDKTCQGKGVFIVAGRDATVRHVTLEGARSPDGNGAGLRLEGAGLLVEHVRFIENEDGILIDANPTATVTVRDSEFLRNGSCVHLCAHGIYAGHIAVLRVERSRFFETHEAHHIKSRAARTEITDCDIEDGPAGTASYLIDAPNGGAVVVRNNKLEKGPHAGNRPAIAIGEEGVSQPTPAIRVDNNSLSNDSNRLVVLVQNRTETEAVLSHNRLSGPVVPLEGPGRVE